MSGRHATAPSHQSQSISSVNQRGGGGRRGRRGTAGLPNGRSENAPKCRKTFFNIVAKLHYLATLLCETRRPFWGGGRARHFISDYSPPRGKAAAATAIRLFQTFFFHLDWAHGMGKGSYLVYAKPLQVCAQKIASFRPTGSKKTLSAHY